MAQRRKGLVSGNHRCSTQYNKDETCPPCVLALEQGVENMEYLVDYWERPSHDSNVVRCIYTAARADKSGPQYFVLKGVMKKWKKLGYYATKSQEKVDGKTLVTWTFPAETKSVKDLAHIKL